MRPKCLCASFCIPERLAQRNDQSCEDSVDHLVDPNIVQINGGTFRETRRASKMKAGHLFMIFNRLRIQ